jgi:hypothetical protein
MRLAVVIRLSVMSDVEVMVPTDLRPFTTAVEAIA